MRMKDKDNQTNDFIGKYQEFPCRREGEKVEKKKLLTKREQEGIIIPGGK
jgi:hypothetical protein